MAEAGTLKADKRSIRKKKVGQLRRQGVLPAVVYGKGVDSLSIEVNYKDFEKLYKKMGFTSVLKLQVEGEKKFRDTFIHIIQRDKMTQAFLHVDFLQIDVNKPVVVEVPIVLKGKCPAEENGKGQLAQDAVHIHVKALPKDMPSVIEVDVTGLENLHQAIHGADLKLPAGASLATEADKELVIVAVVTMKMKEEVAVKVEEAPAEGEEAKAKEAEAAAPKEKEKKEKE
jgi:large subunit ribosomal protein L25